MRAACMLVGNKCLLYVFLPCVVYEYACHSRDCASGYDTCNGRIAFVQGVKDKAAKYEHTDKRERYRHYGRVDDAFCGLVLCLVAVLHFAFGHRYNPFSRAWHYLVVFRQDCWRRQRPGETRRFLLYLDALDLLTLLRTCILHTLSLCRSPHCANHRPSCPHRCGRTCNACILLSGCSLWKRNKVCLTRIRRTVIYAFLPFPYHTMIAFLFAKLQIISFNLI